MKKLHFIFLSAILLVNIAFADADEVVAKCDGTEVKVSEVMKQFQPMLAAQSGGDKKFKDLPPEMKETLVRAYVNIKLLQKEADKSDIKSSKEFQEKLKNVENQLAQQELIEKYAQSHVTDKMIDAEYSKFAKEMKGQDEIKVSHILVKTEKEAQDIKTQLSKGGKFPELASKYSEDKSSQASGGDIGYIVKGQLVPEFEDVAFKLKVNDVSAPVKTQFGWHVIKVVDKRSVKIDENEAKAGIAERLKRESIQQYFTELSEKANVQILLPTEGKGEPQKDK